MKIFEHIAKHHKQNLPFVVYRKPNEHEVSGFFQKNNTLFSSENLSEKGFVFAPFDDSKTAVLIPENQSEIVSEEVDIQEKFNLQSTFVADDSSRENHIKLVAKAIKEIKKGTFKKVVISRKEEVVLHNFNVVVAFKKLLKTYKNAFVYVWFHPKVGLWLGATPETLLKVNNNNFETMSLAGTQSYKGSVIVKWHKKEIDEQQFVTNFIVDNLTPFVKDINISSVETIKAGNLLHLKTKIYGSLAQLNKQIVSCLHPTPAVCGLPKNTAKEFILNKENYNRSFYTGFLGELNKESNLFVNLRCMQIRENKAFIYVGGGITKDSNPEKEWEETVAKTQVMKKVLKLKNH